jgi:hypothetical protein
VTYPGFTPVGNATLVVANVLTCNKHSQKISIHNIYYILVGTGTAKKQQRSLHRQVCEVGSMAAWPACSAMVLHVLLA